MSLSIVILAAGQGKRMQSQTAKVLHSLGGLTLLEHVVATATKLKASSMPLIVYGYQGEKIKHQLAHLNVLWVEQIEQRGTGHAVMQALKSIPEHDRVLILYGDVPLITADTLQRLLTTTPKEAIGIVTTHLPNPQGLGRIIRNKENHIVRIIEEKDATEEELKLTEVNSGIYVIPALYLNQWLGNLNNVNAQQEYYLTDLIHRAASQHVKIHSISPKDYHEILGINDQVQLMYLERYYQKQVAEKLMQRGVRIYDANRFDLRGELTCGQDVVIDINVIIEGKVVIGNNCIIGPNTILRNVIIGDHVEIKANSVIEGAEIGSHCFIGPFARLRAGTCVASYAEIGNFIEIKNSIIGEYTKVHHVGYLGDSELGKRVNIGAGTITCNYDGINKHQTIIGDAAFIGSNTELVAPVKIGEGATIGAGSTITRDAPAHQLTLARANQRSIPDWKRKKATNKEA